MGGIFLINEKANSLVEMNEQQYDSEDVLQTLLAKYPNLLAGDQMDNSSPRKWLLITREATIQSDDSGRWSVDHLFLDQDGIPTLVEVKRSTDTRIRREVVGQMLDYAANAVLYWSVDTIRTRFEAGCSMKQLDPDEEIAKFVGNQFGTDEFWDSVKTNLDAGRIRMVFVSDQIPSELQRIVEFLNRQMNPAEVLAVQIKQYSGSGLKTLVPRVMGLTAEAVDRKKSGKSMGYPGVDIQLEKADENIQDYYSRLQDFLRSLGDDVQIGQTKVYYAFKRKNANFARVIAQKKALQVWLNLDPASCEIPNGQTFIQDKSGVGHLGGNFHTLLTITSENELETAQPYLQRAYDEA